jgi:hypothetical protein
MYGYGRGRFGWARRPVNPRGYTYVGPCRCGPGPHAFYQDTQGSIIQAHHLYNQYYDNQPTKESLKAEMEALKQEKADLEKYIQDLEKEINAEQK